MMLFFKLVVRDDRFSNSQLSTKNNFKNPQRQRFEEVQNSESEQRRNSRQKMGAEK
jgi:hypothetical protein